MISWILLKIKVRWQIYFRDGVLRPAANFHANTYNSVHVIAIKLNLTRSSATTEKQRISCPHGGGLGPPAHSPSVPSGYIYAYGRIQKSQRTYVKRAIHKAHFKMNWAFKVIQGHPYCSRQESRTVCYHNVQLMPTLFPKLTKIWQRENGKFVNFNDPTQV